MEPSIRINDPAGPAAPRVVEVDGELWGRHCDFLLIKDEGPPQSWASCPATFSMKARNDALAGLGDFTADPRAIRRRSWRYRLASPLWWLGEQINRLAARVDG